MRLNRSVIQTLIKDAQQIANVDRIAHSQRKAL